MAMFWNWINRFGALIGIIGFSFGVYTYYRTHPFRELAFYADPTTALIVKSGQSSNLRVYFADQLIKTDVVVAQVVLWNAGNLPIKRENIIQPIVIRTVPPARILEPTFRESTRETVIKPQLDQTNSSDGRIGITWERLEQGDGIWMQMVFAGSPGTQLVIDGVLEEQPHIAVLSFDVKDWFYRIIIICLVGFGSLIAIFFVLTLFFPWGRSKSAKKPRWAVLTLSIIILGTVVSALALAVRSTVLQIQRPRLMPAKLVTPGLREELRKNQGNIFGF